ncbi:MAG: radical SAM protein [Planctomycetes bacterium]|nr:radical SAM protein [Planctomycetota bacterium]
MKTVHIVFKPLYSCPHRCGFCHVLGTPRRETYLSTARVREVFDWIEARFAGCRVELDISGGEFALRTDAVELAQYLRTRRIRWTSLVLDTMGVPFADPELARALGALFTKAHVSVHAPDGDLHRAISRSRTRFEDLSAGLENLFRHFPAVFTNTAILAANHDRLPDIARFVLSARRARPQTPLYSLFCLPVYRRYPGCPERTASAFPVRTTPDLSCRPAASAMQARASEKPAPSSPRPGSPGSCGTTAPSPEPSRDPIYAGDSSSFRRRGGNPGWRRRG